MAPDAKRRPFFSSCLDLLRFLIGRPEFVVAIAASESVAILHTVKRFAAATRPYQRPESFTVRFWLRKST